MADNSDRTGADTYTPIWARPERAAKGPAPSRSRAEIARAAVALADAEGLDAVSMRRLGAALGIGTASLYRYVLHKDELYDLMIDHVEGEEGLPTALSGNWRDDLRALAGRIRRMMHRHPWMASLTTGRPVFGPNTLAWTEHGLAAVDNLGLTIDEMLVTLATLQAFVRGYVGGELAERGLLRRAELTHEEWMTAVGPYMESVAESGAYPLLAKVIVEADSPHAHDRHERLFNAGLDRVLNGVDPEHLERSFRRARR